MCLSCMLAVMCLIELSMHWKKFTHRTLCRVFVAYREEMTGTWINNYSPFVSGFSTEADATTLTSTEV